MAVEGRYINTWIQHNTIQNTLSFSTILCLFVFSASSLPILCLFYAFPAVLYQFSISSVFSVFPVFSLSRLRHSLSFSVSSLPDLKKPHPFSKLLYGVTCSKNILHTVLEISVVLYYQHLFPLPNPSYELTQTSPLAISPQLFRSKLKTLLFSKSYSDSSSSPYLPPRLNSKHHPR